MSDSQAMYHLMLRLNDQRAKGGRCSIADVVEAAAVLVRAHQMESTTVIDAAIDVASRAILFAQQSAPATQK